MSRPSKRVSDEAKVMRTRTPAALLFAVAALAACSSDCADSPTAAPLAPAASDPLPEGDTHFVVSFADRSRKTGLVHGWNLGRGTLYAAENDPFHPEWRTPERTSAALLLRQARSGLEAPPWVRFSGLQIDGALGNDGYHFWNFARPDRVAAPGDNMSTHDFMTLISEMNGGPLVTLNFGSATAREARDYVTHLAGRDTGDPLVAARVQRGHPDPYPVFRFEIGNEVYGFWNTGSSADGPYSFANSSAKNGGDPDWSGKPSSDPASYAARALAYVSAVREVVPDARFWVPLSQASMDAWGGLDAALAALDPLLREPAVEAVVIHHYLVDDGVTLGLSNRGSAPFLLGGTELFRPMFEDLQSRLAKVDRPSPLSIAVTEYHVAGAFSHGKFKLGVAAIVGPALADMMLLYAELGVAHASQHLSLSFDEGAGADVLVERWYNPFRAAGGGAVRPMPSYLATALVAGALRTFTIPLHATKGATLTVPAEDFPSLSCPAVHATAFVDDGIPGDTGIKATLVIVNRDLDASHEVTFDVDPGFSVLRAQRLAPSAWDADATKEELAIEAVDAEKRGDRVRVVAPRVSVTVVDLVRR